MSGEGAEAAELFGGETSSDEEESSDESSGEQEPRGDGGEGVVRVEESGEGKMGGGEGVRAELETSSSSSSAGESGSASEGEEENEGTKAEGVAPESSWKPEGVEPAESSDAPSGTATAATAAAQGLFGDGSSSSSSDSDGGDVIGLDGGSDVEGEGEGGRDQSPSSSQGKSSEVDSHQPAVGERAPQTSGDEAGESEDGTGRSGDRPTQTVEGLFGDAADLSSSDSEAGEGGRGEVSEAVKALEEEGEAETEVPRINVEIPRCSANLGSDQYFVKLPNFLSVETRPFDPALYEDEVEDENEILDEEGRARLKLKVENTIRWRYSQDETGNEVRESNARVVKWSDGTMSLYLGSEIFDIHRQPLQGEFSHLFVRQGTGLQGQAVFHSKLTFRPHSTDSQTHRKMTLSIADRFSKAQKIRVLPAVGLDPESQKKEKIKKEEERLRAAVRRENQQKRVRERNSQRGLTANYIEPDREDDEEEGASVSAIKSSFRKRLSEARGSRGGGVWGGAESEEGESSEEEEGVERLMRAKREQGGTRKRQHVDLPDVDVTHKKQPRRKLLHSDDSEESS